MSDIRSQTGKLLATEWQITEPFPFRPGDVVTIHNVPVYRRWWQFWRPEIVGHETRTLTVVGEASDQIAYIRDPAHPERLPEARKV